jgi:hypothetical protein
MNQGTYPLAAAMVNQLNRVDMYKGLRVRALLQIK